MNLLDPQAGTLTVLLIITIAGYVLQSWFSANRKSQASLHRQNADEKPSQNQPPYSKSS